MFLSGSAAHFVMLSIFCLCIVPAPRSRAIQDSANSSAYSPQTSGPSQKYREILFPSGMPMMEDPFSGTARKGLYAFYSEADLGALKAVLYSQEIQRERGADGIFLVQLALLENAAGRWRVLQGLDLTEFMPVENEFPGNFLKMDGRLTSFLINKGQQGLHVNLWALLSGTGSVSGASDLIYALTSTHNLQLVLTLKGTSKYSRIGAAESYTEDSKILAGDIDGDGSVEIIVQTSRLELVDGKANMTTEEPTVYKFVGGAYQKTGTVDAAKLAARSGELLALPRSKSIHTVPLTDSARQ